MRNLKQGLLDLGYTQRESQQDFILLDNNGRYHVKPEGSVAALHYDLFAPSGLHVTNIPMPIHLQKEVARIQRYESLKMLPDRGVDSWEKVDLTTNRTDNRIMDKSYNHEKVAAATKKTMIKR